MNLQASLEKKSLEKALGPGANVPRPDRLPGSDRLLEENRRFAGTGGVSAANRSLGFQSGFAAKGGWFYTREQVAALAPAG